VVVGPLTFGNLKTAPHDAVPGDPAHLNSLWADKEFLTVEPSPHRDLITLTVAAGPGNDAGLDYTAAQQAAWRVGYRLGPANRRIVIEPCTTDPAGLPGGLIFRRPGCLTITVTWAGRTATAVAAEGVTSCR
jgi:hypothetical protein